MYPNTYYKPRTQSPLFTTRRVSACVGAAPRFARRPTSFLTNPHRLPFSSSGSCYQRSEQIAWQPAVPQMFYHDTLVPASAPPASQTRNGAKRRWGQQGRGTTAFWNKGRVKVM